jgi:cobalt-precorrin 5A hydrolase/precorrin-3B C17-methyltransferase
LCQAIAAYLKGTPILTGATQQFGLPGIDTLGFPFGWRKGEGNWTAVSAELAKSSPIQVIQEVGSTLWQNHLPSTHPFCFEDCSPKTPKIWISAKKRPLKPNNDYLMVQWHPRVLWVGIGCIRGVSPEIIAQGITEVCKQYQLATDAIAGLATIDLKADEAGILEYCQSQDLPLKTFTADQLSQVNVPHPSPNVQQAVGTP